MRFLITLLLATGAMASHAAPRYYTFTGRILEIDDTLAGYRGRQGFGLLFRVPDPHHEWHGNDL